MKSIFSYCKSACGGACLDESGVPSPPTAFFPLNLEQCRSASGTFVRAVQRSQAEERSHWSLEIEMLSRESSEWCLVFPAPHELGKACLSIRPSESSYTWWRVKGKPATGESRKERNGKHGNLQEWVALCVPGAGGLSDLLKRLRRSRWISGAGPGSEERARWWCSCCYSRHWQEWDEMLH